MNQLPVDLYTAAQVRELDRTAIERCGIPGLELMQRAGYAAFALLRKTWPSALRIGVVCGLGNNAGDGFVLARLAHLAKLDVRVLLVADFNQLRGDALSAFRELQETGVAIESFAPSSLAASDVIVDALFGTGLAREVSGPWRTAIEAINANQAPVLALDLPSGLNADTGTIGGVAVEADVTITFVGLKQGLLTGCAPDFCGQLVFDSLDIPDVVYETVTPSARRLLLENLVPLLPRRRRTAHKGDNGRVLIIGGDLGMMGAARMAAEAAIRIGAGLVTVATRPQHAPLLAIACPELMAYGIESAVDMHLLLAQADIVAIGPGLGRHEWGELMFETAIQTSRPLVVDADALNILAGRPYYRGDWVLTPHPGEAGRLLGCATADVQASRFQAARELQQLYGGSVVLKGAGTLICHKNGLSLCAAGNPGMASGGMGDILTGTIAGLLAQGLTPVAATELGVLIHGLAADRAAMAGERGMKATDLLPHLRRLVNFL